MKVLSLFDGISCGRLALQRAGVPVEAYLASEIDESAITVSQNNFPEIMHIGPVEQISVPPGDIDLLIGGSPCQDLSLMGTKKGLAGARSGLFFEYLRILRWAKPKYFLLENVRMSRENLEIISEMTGVTPIGIDSADFSAQTRFRLYWTNIPVLRWEPKNITIADILDDCDPPDNYFINLDNHVGERALYNIKRNTRDLGGKIKCLTTQYRATCSSGTAIALPDGRLRTLTSEERERAQTLPTGYTAGFSRTARAKMVGNAWTVDVIAHIFRGLLCE